MHINFIFFSEIARFCNTVATYSMFKSVPGKSNNSAFFFIKVVQSGFKVGIRQKCISVAFSLVQLWRMKVS